MRRKVENIEVGGDYKNLGMYCTSYLWFYTRSSKKRQENVFF
jgi:hypothetical protein